MIQTLVMRNKKWYSNYTMFKTKLLIPSETNLKNE